MVIETGRVETCVAPATDMFNNIVPDRSGSSDTNYPLVEFASVCIARPYSHHDIGCIAHSPVVFKVLSRAGFCRDVVLLCIDRLPVQNGKLSVTHKLHGA